MASILSCQSRDLEYGDGEVTRIFKPADKISSRYDMKKNPKLYGMKKILLTDM